MKSILSHLCVLLLILCQFAKAQELKIGVSEQSSIMIRGTVQPASGNRYNLGTDSVHWNDVYINKGLYTNEQLTINDTLIQDYIRAFSSPSDGEVLRASEEIYLRDSTLDQLIWARINLLQARLEAQEETIELLQDEIEMLRKEPVPTKAENLLLFDEPIELLQNKPNPFSRETRIEMKLPGKVLSAEVKIYDLQGRELKSIPVHGRGATFVTVQGYELDSGIYVYALIADGDVIGTKRMILTR